MGPLIALLGVLIVPLFAASWRVSLLGLAAQGLLLGWIALGRHPEPTAATWLTLADLIAVRGVAAPLLLYDALRRRSPPPRNDVIPTNLLAWALAIGVVVVAFAFAQRLVAEPGEGQLLVAATIAAVLFGFLVLATQTGAFSQVVGVLRIENGIALFELGGHRHEGPLAVQAGQIAVVALTIAVYRWFLGALPHDASDQARPVEEGPAL